MQGCLSCYIILNILQLEDQHVNMGSSRYHGKVMGELITGRRDQNPRRHVWLTESSFIYYYLYPKLQVILALLHTYILPRT